MAENGRDRLDEWLRLISFGKEGVNVEWAKAPEYGRVIAEGWTKFDGNIESLPTDEVLNFRVINGPKRPKRFLLRSIISEDGNNNRSNSYAIIPPEIAEKQRELESRENRLKERESRLIEWENILSDKEMDIRKSLVIQIETGKKLEERVKNTGQNLETWEKHLELKKSSDLQHIEDVADRDETIAELRQQQFIAASINTTIERIANTIVLSKAKKFEDIPATMVADFQAYLKDRKDRNFYREHPGVVNDFLMEFGRLPDDKKFEFYSELSRWALRSNGLLVSQLFTEIQEEMSNEQQGAEGENENG